MILLEPVGLDSGNVGQAWPLTYCRSLLNTQTLRQRSHTLGSEMWCLSLIQYWATRGEYLALSKAWHSCYLLWTCITFLLWSSW